MNLREHLLDCLSEEASELIQAAMKINRFGLWGKYGDGTTNHGKLIAEYSDVLAVMELLREEKIIDCTQGIIRMNIDAKKKKLRNMMARSAEQGNLELQGGTDHAE